MLYFLSCQVCKLPSFLVSDPEEIAEELNDPAEQGHEGEEEGVAEMRVLGPGPHLLHPVWLHHHHYHYYHHHHHHLQPVHGDGVLVVAGVGAAHCLGPPHKLGVVAELEVELRGGAEAGQEHVLQVYKWGASRKNNN